MTMNEDLMDSYEENTITAVRPFFPKMIAISLALHFLFAIIFTGGGTGRPGDPTVNYLDLTMTEPALNPAKPAVTEPPVTAPVEEAKLPAEDPIPLPPQAPPTEAEKLSRETADAINSAKEQPEAMHKVSFGLGLLNGHFGTIADGRTLRSDMREYHLSLLRAINENWWRNGNKFEGMNSAIATIMVSRSGEIINAQIMQSSGNPSYDRILIKSLLAAGPLPPLPSFFEAQVFTAPIKFNPPLSLFGSSPG